MVGRSDRFAPTNQEYWEEHYDGDEDIQEAAADLEAVVDAMDSEYQRELFGEEYGVESLYEAPEEAFEAFGNVFGQDADEMLERDDSQSSMNVPENMADASRSGEYKILDPMEDQSTNAVTRR